MERGKTVNSQRFFYEGVTRKNNAFFDVLLLVFEAKLPKFKFLEAFVNKETHVLTSKVIILILKLVLANFLCG